MLERQRLGTIRTDDSPWRDKRANDSGTQRLTHTRWDRTRHIHCGQEPADGASLAPGMAPKACSISSNYFSELEPRYGIEP